MIPNGIAGLRSFRFAVVVWSALMTTPAWADKQVIFARLTDGPEFDEAMAFFERYLEPDNYDTRKHLNPNAGWKLGNTLDLYLREFVQVGKGDIDDDGIEERFYIFDDPIWCGSSGCRIIILRKQAAAWQPICEMSGSDHHVWISDWMSEGGRREMKARWGVFWRNGQCHDDDPKVLEEYGPENTAQRGERTWKPMR